MTSTTFAKVEAPTLAIDALLFKDGKVSANGKLERRIVANLLEFMAHKGWKVSSVYDGEEETATADATAAMELIFNLDEVSVRFADQSEKIHGVLLVLGNGIDIIADWNYSEGDVDGFNAAISGFDAEEYA